MPALHLSPLRVRRLSLAAASALPLIAILSLAGTAHADTWVSGDASRILYSGRIGSAGVFARSPIINGSNTGYTIYSSNPDLANDPNTVTDGAGNLLPGAISRDGSTVIGIGWDSSGANRLFAWTEASGLTFIDTGATSGSFRFDLVDDNGSAFTGTVDGQDAFYVYHNTFTLLGNLGGGRSFAYGLSGDGKTVVGESQDQDGNSQGFVWNRDTRQMTGIGFLSGGTWSAAVFASYDGSVVAGQAADASGNDRAFRWTSGGGLVNLGSFEGDGQVRLNAMNRDGSALVGYAGYQPANQGVQYRAFRWADGTMQDIHATRFTRSEARDVSDDGSVVVGSVEMLQQSNSNANPTSPSGNGAPSPSPSPGGGGSTVSRGFRWTQETGMITVEEWLRDAGVSVAEDFSQSATSVSADGKTVIGQEITGDIYIAHVGETSGGGGTPDGGTGGVISVTDYLTSAAQTNSVAIGLQTSSTNTVMFGAQGSPMRNLLEVGRRSAWGTVDTGYDSGTKSEGALVLGDFGFGYGLMDGVTVRLQTGATFTDQDLYDGGAFQSRGWYVAPEVTANLLGDLYLTVGGLYGRGDLDIKRGYRNGSSLDFSTGETDTETLAGKVRIDWLNAVTLGDAAFTPYLALSRTLAKTDAYVETGGGFPAAHDAMNEHATFARFGIDGTYKLNDTVTLLARAEAAYRFEEQTSGTSTEVAGIRLAVPGEDIKQFWLRGGIGTEIAVGGGVASFMLNATTESDDTDIWLRSGWKVDF
ncbi:autotransporter domain-containing protein [Rhizobium wuzhouense]|uniref:Autotransporter domain-containing protein n=1 Tax=Rhizobium wuzhouense TaxID=1986026 RepID=A0ABX5NX37_9HYPH|nr:autotransporter domain-containing protein [Rhizobium wuzhouense]PYB76879.1 hypothetical protein DMY87_00295 [Rhizobium wuzhouense]